MVVGEQVLSITVWIRFVQDDLTLLALPVGLINQLVGHEPFENDMAALSLVGPRANSIHEPLRLLAFEVGVMEAISLVLLVTEAARLKFRLEVIALVVVASGLLGWRFITIFVIVIGIAIAFALLVISTTALVAYAVGVSITNGVSIEFGKLDKLGLQLVCFVEIGVIHPCLIQCLEQVGTTTRLQCLDVPFDFSAAAEIVDDLVLVQFAWDACHFGKLLNR